MGVFLLGGGITRTQILVRLLFLILILIPVLILMLILNPILAQVLFPVLFLSRAALGNAAGAPRFAGSPNQC